VEALKEAQPPRSVQVRCSAAMSSSQPCHVLQLPGSKLRRLQHMAPLEYHRLRETADRREMRHACKSWLEKDSEIRDADRSFLNDLSQHVRYLSVSKGQSLVSTEEESVYVLRNGELSTERGVRTVGQMVSTKECVAATRCDLLQFPGAVIRKLLAQYPHQRSILEQALGGQLANM